MMKAMNYPAAREAGMPTRGTFFMDGSEDQVRWRGGNLLFRCSLRLK